MLQVILMDHVDWLDMKAAKALAKLLARQVNAGGRVIWRSAALCPPYARIIEEAGFDVSFLSYLRTTSNLLTTKGGRRHTCSKHHFSNIPGLSHQHDTYRTS